MIYLLNFLLVPLYYFVIRAFFSKKKADRVFFVTVAIHAVLFRALANPYVYTDTQGYSYAFESIATMNFKEAVLSVNYWSRWGQGYVAFNWLISRFTHDPRYLFVVLSILSVGGVMLFYRKISTTPLLTVMLYLLYPMMYVMGFGVVRQHLAIVFVLWALYYANNLKISVPLIAIGILFHTTALVFLPFYFIRKLNVKKMNSLKIMIFSVVGFLLMSLLVGYVISFTERYEDVMEREGDSRNFAPVVFLGLTITGLLITGAIRKVKDVKDSLIVRYLIYGLIVAIFATTVPRAGRLPLYFLYCIPVAISVMYKYCNKANKLIVNAIVAIIFALTAVMVYHASAKYESYMFIWEKVI